MNQVERDLRESMRQRQPPSDFADKVLSRARRSEMRRMSRTWLAAAAMVTLMIGAGAFVQMQRRHAEGERAKEQLMVALRITGSKFRDIQQRLIGTQQHAAQPRSKE